MRLLDTIQNQRIIEAENGVVLFFGDMDIDCDGSGGNPDGDPYFQADTTLHYKGKALNPYTIPYIVVPPAVVKKTSGIVMGCHAVITDAYTGKTINAVVADLGPSKKVGEASVEAAKRLNLTHSPITGGVDDMNQICYEVYPGVPAQVDGVTYDLQPS